MSDRRPTEATPAFATVGYVRACVTEITTKLGMRFRLKDGLAYLFDEELKTYVPVGSRNKALIILEGI